MSFCSVDAHVLFLTVLLLMLLVFYNITSYYRRKLTTHYYNCRHSPNKLWTLVFTLSPCMTIREINLLIETIWGELVRFRSCYSILAGASWYYSLVPSSFTSPVFDRLQYAHCKQSKPGGAFYTSSFDHLQYVPSTSPVFDHLQLHTGGAFYTSSASD